MDIAVVNPVLWVVANVLLAYSGVALFVFVFGYLALFNPFLTTVGRYLFLFMVSLLGVTCLSFVGIFVDPAPDSVWYRYPTHMVEWWRPGLRFVVYSFVAITVSMLSVVLVYRKWFPHKLRTARDLELITPRKEKH